MKKERFTIEVIDDSEDTMRNYLGYVKDENGDVLSEVGMYWDELLGEDEDFDEDDEDSDELPFFEYTVSKNIYRANKEFFDKFAKDKGFVVKIDNDEDEDYWNGVRIQGHLDVSPTMRTVKKLTNEFLKTLKDNGVTPFADHLNGELLNTEKIELDFNIDEDHGDKIIDCSITNGDGDKLLNTCLDFYEDYGEDYDEDDEDSEDEGSDPFVTFYFYKETSELYKLNKGFFDQYFKNIGAELIEDECDEETIVFGYNINISPTVKSLRAITKELITAMKKANLKSPFTHEE